MLNLQKLLSFGVLILGGVCFFYSQALARFTQTPQQTNSFPQIVRSIEFRGSDHLADETLRQLVKTKEGDVYDPEQVKRDFQLLLMTGPFSKWRSCIQVEEVEGGGLVVAFCLYGGPVIQKISYSGLKSLVEEEFAAYLKKKKISLCVGSLYDSNDEDHAAEELQKLLRAKGHPQAKVDSNMEWVDENWVVVTFNVDENPRARIVAVEFEGNTSFSNEELVKVMKRFQASQRPASRSVDAVYDLEELEEDVKDVYGFLIKHGFARPQIGESKVEDGKQGRKVTIPIEEGPMYCVGEVAASGSTLLRPDQIIKLSGMKSGDVAAPKFWVRTIGELAKIYVQKGKKPPLFLLDFIYKPARPGDRKEIVDVEFIIAEEDSTYLVRQVEFLGNETTRDQVLRRTLSSNEGEGYNRRVLERDVLRIKQLGLFDEVEIGQIEFDEQNKQVDIQIKVKEK